MNLSDYDDEIDVEGLDDPWAQDDVDAELGFSLGKLGALGGAALGTALLGPGMGTTVGAIAGGGGAKLIGSALGKKGKRKKVVSISGRTSMTPSGQLVTAQTLSRPVADATGNASVANIAIMSGLANIQTSLAKAETRAVDHGYRKIMRKLDVMSQCACSKKLDKLVRLRSALGM
jgi:hypothetical protein